jgi:diguanylate cyclase
VTNAANIQYQPYQYAQKVLERLVQDKLAPNPNNYAVYYYYFTGTNPNLKMAVDTLLTNQKSLTQENCDELYQAHLGLEAEQRVMQDTTTVIEKEIERVLKEIDNAATNTSQYSKTLDSFSGELASTNSLEQIRSAVTKVVAETRTIAKQNERLAGQLAQTTQQLSEVRYNFDQVHKELQIDPLTEVGNRKMFETQLTLTTNEARENNTPLTLLMIDIDHFKKFNDAYGHQIGDQVLRLVARTLVENLKGRDVIARYGGEEFVILLPMTKALDGEKVANQLRASLGSKQVKRRGSEIPLGIVTVSVGVAEYSPGEEREMFITRADAALYKAKNAGRNQVMIAE